MKAGISLTKSTRFPRCTNNRQTRPFISSSSKDQSLQPTTFSENVVKTIPKRLYSRIANDNSPYSFFYSQKNLTRDLEEPSTLLGSQDNSPNQIKNTITKFSDEYSVVSLLLFRNIGSAKDHGFNETNKLLNIKAAQERRNKRQSIAVKNARQASFSNLGRSDKSVRSPKVIGYRVNQLKASKDFIDQERINQFAKKTSEVTAKDVSTFLKINAQTNSGPSHFLEYIEELIFQSNQYTLPAIAEFITDYLWSGSEFFKELPKDYMLKYQANETQLDLVLNQALKVLPETTVSVSSGEIEEIPGVRQLIFIEKLLDSFNGEKSAQLKDLFLRIVARSGTYGRARTVLVKYLNAGVLLSEETVDVFVRALNRYNAAQLENFSGSIDQFNVNVKEEISEFQHIFDTTNITPAIAEFLLSFVYNVKEFYFILNAIETSHHRDAILGCCQAQLINAIVRCHLYDKVTSKLDNSSTISVSKTSSNDMRTTRAMSHMFGLLTRFQDTTSGVTRDALEEMLAISAQLGNASGMHRTLAIKRERFGEKHKFSNETLSKVFDAFPISKGAMSQEKINALSSPWIVNEALIIDSSREETVLFHLRGQLNLELAEDAKTYTRYLAALGRCERSDLLLHEWSQIKDLTLSQNNDFLENPYSQDIMLELFTAMKNSKSDAFSSEILSTILQACTRSEVSRGYILNFTSQVIRKRLYPVVPLLYVISKWSLSTASGAQTIETDLEKIFHDLPTEEMVDTSSFDKAVIPSFSENETSFLVVKNVFVDLIRNKDQSANVWAYLDTICQNH